MQAWNPIISGTFSLLERVASRCPKCPDCACPPLTVALTCAGPASTGAISTGSTSSVPVVWWCFAGLPCLVIVFGYLFWRRGRRPSVGVVFEQHDRQVDTIGPAPRVLTPSARRRLLNGMAGSASDS